MSLELVIALMAFGVSLATAVVVLSRPRDVVYLKPPACRLELPRDIAALWDIVHALNRVAMSVDRQADRMPDLKADRAQRHAMRLSRALHDVDASPPA